MTPRELRKARKRSRKNVAAFRERQRKLQDITNKFVRENTPNSEPDEQLGQERQENQEDRRKLAARKRSLKLRKNRNKLMQKKNAEIEELKKKLQKYKKRLQRAKNYIESEPVMKTPNSKVDKMLNNSTPSATEKIKRNLLFGEVMKQQLNENFSKLSSPKEKTTFTRAVTGDLVKKYKVHREIGHITKKMIVNASKSNALLEHNRKTRKDKISNTTKTIVEQFLEDDSNSRLCAGKKEYVTKYKQRKQKRILTDTMKNLHKKFLSAGLSIMSYNMFCKLRPFWIVQPNVNNRDTCLCIVHANFELLIQSLNQANIITIPNYQKLLETICCNRYDEACLARKCQQCLKKHIKYGEFDNAVPIGLKQWEIIAEEIIDAKSKNPRTLRKYSKKISKLPPRYIIMRLEDSLAKFLNHQPNIVHQYNEFKMLKSTISHEDCIIHMDFSENYNTKYSQEIQAFHFGGSRSQISLHTIVIYTRSLDGSVKTTCACTFSSNLAHGPAAIWAHLQPIFKLLPESIKNIHFLSDGPVTQYRNKTMLYMWACQLEKFYPKIRRFSWNFHEAGHGKGAPDGVGAVVKRTADKFVALERDISSLDALVNIVKENSPEMRVYVIKDEDINEMAAIIAENAKDIVPSKGTLQIHQVCGNVCCPNKIVMKSLSCFCDEDCEHYKLGVLEYRNKRSIALAVDDIYSASENESEELMQNAGPSNLCRSENRYSTGDFVLVQLSGMRNTCYRYAAICSGDIVDEQEEEIKVTFLRICDDEGLLFKVADDDVSYVGLNQILYSLPLPELVMKGDRHFYKFPKAVDVFEK